MERENLLSRGVMYVLRLYFKVIFGAVLLNLFIYHSILFKIQWHVKRLFSCRMADAHMLMNNLPYNADIELFELIYYFMCVVSSFILIHVIHIGNFVLYYPKHYYEMLCFRYADIFPGENWPKLANRESYPFPCVVMKEVIIGIPRGDNLAQGN